jgi:outer membrane biosynthesis protein TonB
MLDRVVKAIETIAESLRRIADAEERKAQAWENHTTGTTDGAAPARKRRGKVAQEPVEPKDAPAPVEPKDAPAPVEPKDAPAPVEPQDAPAPAAKPVKELEVADVRVALQALMFAHGNGAVAKVLHDAGGVSLLRNLDPSKFAAVIAAANIMTGDK